MPTFSDSVRVPATGHLRSVSLASTSSSQTTGMWQLAGQCRAYLAVCKTSTLTAGTATYKLQSASDANGSGAADISGSFTLVHSAAGSVGVLEVPASLIPAAKPYVSIVCTTASGTGTCDGTLLMADPTFRP